MKKIGFMIATALIAATSVQAETLALWENDNIYTATNSTPVDMVSTNVSASDLALGAGFAVPGDTWENALDTYLSDVSTITNLSSAIANNRYYSFTVTPNLGKQADYSNVAARVTLNDSNAAGASVQVVLMSSATGFMDGDEIGSFVASTLNNDITDNGLIDIDVSALAALQDQPSPVEFRLYVVPISGSFSRVALGHIFFVDGTDDVRVDGLVEDSTELPIIKLASWENDNVTARGARSNAVDTVASGVSASDLALSARWYNDLAPWPNSIWALCSDLPAITNLSESIASNRYFNITMDPDAGKQVDYTKVSVRITLNSAGTYPGVGTSVKFVLMSSATGFNDGDEIGSFDAVHDTLGGTVNATDNGLLEMDISGVAALQNISDPVEFRVYVVLNDTTSARWSIGHIFYADNADDVVVTGRLEDAPVLPTKPATIVAITSVSSSLMKMVVNAPDAPALYYPLAKTDLVNSGWSMVAHSDDGVNPFVVTNLSYSTVEGTNEVIYVQASDAAKFFGINEQ